MNSEQCYLFKANKKKINQSIELQIEGNDVKQVESTKFLGIYIDSNLNWKQHIKHTTNKISKVCGILCRARHFLSSKILRNLYYTLVYPYLQYGNTIWANTYPSRLDAIRKIQKKILRIITFSNYKDHTIRAWQFYLLIVLTLK